MPDFTGLTNDEEKLALRLHAWLNRGELPPPGDIILLRPPGGPGGLQRPENFSEAAEHSRRSNELRELAQGLRDRAAAILNIGAAERQAQAAIAQRRIDLIEGMSPAQRVLNGPLMVGMFWFEDASGGPQRAGQNAEMAARLVIPVPESRSPTVSPFESTNAFAAWFHYGASQPGAFGGIGMYRGPRTGMTHNEIMIGAARRSGNPERALTTRGGRLQVDRRLLTINEVADIIEISEANTARHAVGADALHQQRAERLWIERLTMTPQQRAAAQRRATEAQEFFDLVENLGRPSEGGTPGTGSMSPPPGPSPLPFGPVDPGNPGGLFGTSWLNPKEQGAAMAAAYTVAGQQNSGGGKGGVS